MRLAGANHRPSAPAMPIWRVPALSAWCSSRQAAISEAMASRWLLAASFDTNTRAHRLPKMSSTRHWSRWVRSSKPPPSVAQKSRCLSIWPHPTVSALNDDVCLTMLVFQIQLCSCTLHFEVQTSQNAHVGEREHLASSLCISDAPYLKDHFQMLAHNNSGALLHRKAVCPLLMRPDPECLHALHRLQD